MFLSVRGPYKLLSSCCDSSIELMANTDLPEEASLAEKNDSIAR
jgi:hypothetical protein